MPVYNGAAYLDEAIESILGQTYCDFEFIIINDGSIDESAEIIQKYDDSRIRYYEQSNQGLAATLNNGIGLASGKYLARQDQDDISFPERFVKQTAFLDSHPDYGMIGSWAEILTEDGFKGRVHRHVVDSPLLKATLLFTNPFVHSSVMIRKSCLDEVGGYATDPLRQPPEDFELWSRIARHHEVANIPEYLVRYREVAGSMSRTAGREFWERVVTISGENILAILGGQCDREIARGAARLLHCDDDPTGQPELKNVARMMQNIAYTMEQRYPKYHGPLRRVLKAHYRLILFHHYAPCLGSMGAKLLASVRSKGLFW